MGRGSSVSRHRSRVAGEAVRRRRFIFGDVGDARPRRCPQRRDVERDSSALFAEVVSCFPGEGLQAGVQPIVAGRRVYVGTMRGRLHAIDADTGDDIWTFRAGGAILHTCAVADGKVFFGAADGKAYAVDATSGEHAWSFRTGAAVWNSPVVYEAAVYIGSRDGRLYALSTTDGRLRWAGAVSVGL